MSCRKFVIRFDHPGRCAFENVEAFSEEEAIQSFTLRYLKLHPECGFELPSPIEIREIGSAVWKTALIDVQMKPSVAVRFA